MQEASGKESRKEVERKEKEGKLEGMWVANWEVKQEASGMETG
jgi:hypothetical protein